MNLVTELKFKEWVFTIIHIYINFTCYCLGIMIKRYLIPILITIQIVSGQPTPDSIDPVVLQKADKENVKV